MKSYETLIDKYKGQNKSAFVLGAGTSLYNDWSTYRFQEVFDNVVVSVNSSIVSVQWENGDKNDRYWISNDSLCRRWTWWQKVKESQCIKIVRDSWKKYEKELPGFLVFSPRPTKENVINVDDKGLCYCSSVPSAIDLCIQMGCTNIFLLGVDHCEIGGRTHFWQLMPEEYYQRQLKPAQGPFKQQQEVFKYNIMAYKALKEFAKIKNVGIYNCSMESKVDIFYKIDFDTCLNMIKK
jgi:hypothetical protein